MTTNLNLERTLSPLELARAIGSSESSVKRWVDAGRIPARVTSGGHRRIELMPAMKFLRESGLGIEDASLLGLATGPSLDDQELLSEHVFQLLRDGNGSELTRVLLTALVTRAASLASLFDGPLRSAMTRLGHLWEKGLAGVYVEHRATQLLLPILDKIEALFDRPSDEVIAVGGSIDGDYGNLPSRMAAVVLASEGIRPVNLGSNTPSSAFLHAAEDVDARLVWISASYVNDVYRQSRELTGLTRELSRRGITTIMGGRELHRLTIPEAGRILSGKSMQDLADAAREVRSRSDASTVSPEL